MMKFVKILGQPLCIALYIAGIILAVKKKFVPLISLFLLHASEYLIIGRKTAKEYGFSFAKGLVSCLAFGFTWWLPIRKERNNKGVE